MDENEWLAERFEEHRAHLRSVAYRMLGSLAEADDAVQDTWLRLSRTGAGEVENLGGWLTTIVARVCLNMLRSRSTRREDSLDVRLPDPVISPEGRPSPTRRRCWRTRSASRSSSCSTRCHRPSGSRSCSTTCSTCPSRRSRPWSAGPRRRVSGAAVPTPDPDLARQRVVVDAFFRAARAGDFDALVAVLHPDVVLRADFGARRPAAPRVVRGAAAVAGQAVLGALPAAQLHPALVNGAAGAVVTVDGRPFAVLGFTVAEGRILEIDAIADPDRVARIAAAVLDDE